MAHEIKEVKYNGQTATPNDYTAPDGDLEISLNVINEDGGLKPIPNPDVIYQFHDGGREGSVGDPRIVFIHKTAQYTHYIQTVTVEDTEHIYIGDPDLYTWLLWIDEGSPNATTIGGDTGLIKAEVKQINAVGNTLCVLCSDAMRYYLWKDGEYKYLGTHLPEMPLSFSLRCVAKESQQHTLGIGTATVVLGGNTVSVSGLNEVYWPTANNPEVVLDNDTQRAYIEYFTNAILAEVNRFVADKSTNDGKFIHPFLVRYAYRLYDNSLTMHSSPVLMIPSSDWMPRAFINARTTTASTSNPSITVMTSITYFVAAMVSDLEYQCLNAADRDNLMSWSDIVNSVDIFISAPISIYNQAGKVEGFLRKPTNAKGYTVGRIPGSNAHHLNNQTTWGIAYDYDNDYSKLTNTVLMVDYSTTPATGNVDYLGYYEFILPHFSEDVVIEKIKECGQFFLLKSIKLDDISTTRKLINVSPDYLGSLTTRELMSDDYDSHDTILPKRIINYNSRLNAIGDKKIVAIPNCPQYYELFTNKHWSFTDGGVQSPWSATASQNYATYIYIHAENGRDIIVVHDGTSGIALGDEAAFPFLYFYYPNPNAYKMQIVAYDSNNDVSHIYELPLERHVVLNGAVLFKGFNHDFSENIVMSSTNPGTPSDTPPEPTNYRSLIITNKIYLSEVDNPFYFPPTLISTVGSGVICNIAAATQPISQGQFGQHPLYAFCSDGVWALSVSDVGSYKAVQPISRDVCTNPDSVTPIDNAVLFAADRGIMLIAGGQTTCISDTIADQFPFDLARLPKLLQVFTNAVTLAKFDEFLQGCQMIYDYTHQRIVVFNGTMIKDTAIIDPTEQRKAYNKIQLYKYAYVYSLLSKKWGMMQSNYLARVNSYPEALATTIPYATPKIPSGVMAVSNLVNFSAEIGETTTIPTALILTRPLKLGAADILKTVHSVIQRGYMDRSDVKVVMYGSRNLKDWHLISSSTDGYLRHVHGSPWKYFRFAIIADLAPDETLVSATVQVENRYTNRLR